MKYIKLLKIFGIVLIVIFLSLDAANAQGIQFEASVDKNSMSFEDVLVLSFVLSGSNIDMNVAPELPNMKEDFDILRGPSRSQNISIVNGRQSSSLTIQYILSPKKTGTLEIGPATITQNKKTYTTTPIAVEVLNASSVPLRDSQAQQGVPEEAQPDVFLRAEVDKETVYIGEQITISYKLYTRLDISGYEISQQPSFTGFWIEELQIPNPPKLQMTNINGQQYGVALMKKVALFPTSSGNVTIDPMVMAFAVKVRGGRSRDPFDMFGDSFFGRTEQIIRKTQPLSLKILPLSEENRPATFNGDVGAFTMSVDADPREVKQDEPVTLTIKIQGTGNIKTVKEPVITLPDSFKQYDTQISESPFTLQEPLQGEKVFETVVIPSSDGTFQIDPVLFSYFDPQRASYQTLRSQPLNLVVLPKTEQEEPMERRIATKEEIKLLGQDIRFIKTDVKRLKEQGRYWYQHALFDWAMLLPLLCIAAAWGYKRHREKYIGNARYLRRKRANKLSKQRLQKARDLLDSGDVKAFYAAISTTLRHYLGDKLNIPPAGITGSEVSRILREHGLEENTAQRLVSCLETCDYARFAPVKANRDDMQSIIRDVEVIIQEIEKLKGLGTSSKKSATGVMSFFIFMVLCLGLSSDSEGDNIPVEELFQQGNELYEQGQYQEAIAQYVQILATGLENGYVYYNLGNALLKEQQVGEAILQYERAKRLLPRDEDIDFNLEYARALTLDKMGQEGGKLSRFFTAIRTYFTPNEVSLIFWLAYGLLTVVAIAFIFIPHRWKLRMVYLALPLALLLLGSAILLYLQMSRNNADEAILMIPQIEAKTGPGESYSALFEIHEGAKVRIQREKLDWVEIKLPNKVIGWIPKAYLERI